MQEREILDFLFFSKTFLREIFYLFHHVTWNTYLYIFSLLYKWMSVILLLNKLVLDGYYQRYVITRY